MLYTDYMRIIFPNSLVRTSNLRVKSELQDLSTCSAIQRVRFSGSVVSRETRPWALKHTAH